MVRCGLGASAPVTLSLALVAALSGCTSGVAGGRVSADLREKPPEGRSSGWSSVLPGREVASDPLAMSEYASDFSRLDERLGVRSGPAGQPLSYYDTASSPSLDLPYRFTLPQSADSVTIFRRSEQVYTTRRWGWYDRAR